MKIEEQFGAALKALGGAAATVGAGIAGLSGNALFDFALNPRSKNSIMARVGAGEVDGIDNGAFANDPFRAEARGWFQATRQSLAIEPTDGGELLGWLMPQPGVWAAGDGRSIANDGVHGRYYAIICHGYAGRPQDMCREAYLAHREGLTILMPAARGHERNADRYVGMGWLDSKDLLRWIGLITASDPEAHIALYGVSMGGAEVMMASGLDLPANVRCIVEDCGYTSVWDEFAVQIDMQLHLPAVPFLNTASAVCRVRAGYGFKEASAVKRLRRARVPMLFIHGTADVFVPYRMLDEVFAACASPVKERFAVEGAGHGLSSVTDPGGYWDRVSGFLRTHLLA